MVQYLDIFYSIFWLTITLIPTVLLIKNWKKSNLLKKIVVLLPLLLVALFSSGFIIYSFPAIYQPIYEEINIENIKINETYEYSAVLMLPSYLAGFEIESTRGHGWGSSDRWPKKPDVEIEMEYSETGDLISFDETLGLYNSHGNSTIEQGDFGILIKPEQFKEYNFRYKIKTIPPEYVKSIHLKVDDSGYWEFWGYYPFVHMMNLIVVYVPLLLHFLVLFILKRNREHWKTD